MKKHLLLVSPVILLFTVITASAQVGINTTGAAPDNSAMLDVVSTSKGMLIPRMTATQRDAIPNPSTGLMVYVTTNQHYYFYNGSAWIILFGGNDAGWTISGNDMFSAVSGNVGIGIQNPSTKLSLLKTFPTTNTVEDILEIIRFTSGTPGPGIGAGLIFTNQIGGGLSSISGRISSVMESVGYPSSPSESGMLFQTRAWYGYPNALYLDPNGNVGIGTIDPSSKVEIVGAPSVLTLNSYPTFSPGIIIKEDGSTLWNITADHSSDDLKFSSGSYTNLIEFAQNGRIDHHFQGTGIGLSALGSPASGIIFYDIQNNSSGDGAALSASMINPSAGTFSKGLKGTNAGAGYGVYGEALNTFSGTGVYGKHSVGNFGYLGGNLFGIYGSNSLGFYGYIGGNPYAIFGANTSDLAYQNYAYIGSNSFALYARHSSGNFGYIGDNGYGLWASNANNNYGFIGSNSFGMYATNANGSYGYIGSSAFGIYASHTDGNSAYLGSQNHGVYGYLSSTAVGDWAIYGYGVHSSGVNGSGYGMTGTLGAQKGYNYFGNPYTFGVAGYSYLDYNRSGGCFGSKQDGSVWGSMGYKDSGGTMYGGYFTSTTTGAGKGAQTSIDIGIGAWGDLFGADIHGNIYGLFAEGGDYALYAHGDVYRDGLDVHLQSNGINASTPLYTMVATDAIIQTCGYATLTSGACNVTFDASFSSAVSSSEPIVVTVTPNGNCNGVYLTGVNRHGFNVVENNSGKSNVTVSYIAMGKRAGFENPVLPAAVVASDYIEKLSRGLHNDSDTKSNGEGLFYEGGNLTVGIHPSTLPDPNKPTEDPNLGEIEDGGSK